MNKGFTLIEVMIVVSILAILTVLGLPSYNEWIKNTKIRSWAESVSAGLQLARGEAIKRNTAVQFQLVSSLDNSCTTSVSASNWIVSVKDAESLCGTTPEADPPIIVQSTSPDSNGTVTTLITESPSNSTANPGVGNGVICFGSVGRLYPGAGASVNALHPLCSQAQAIKIDIGASGESCVSGGGRARCLRVCVANGGQIHMCDPAVSDTTDPRYCSTDPNSC